MNTFLAWRYLLARLVVGSLVIGLSLPIVPIVGIGLSIVLGGVTVEIALRAGLVTKWQDTLFILLSGGFLFLIILLTVIVGCNIGHNFLPACTQATSSRSMTIIFAMLMGGIMIMLIASLLPGRWRR